MERIRFIHISLKLLEKIAGGLRGRCNFGKSRIFETNLAHWQNWPFRSENLLRNGSLIRPAFSP